MENVKAKKYLELVAVQDVNDMVSHMLLTSDIHTSGLEGIEPKDGTDVVVIAGDVMGAGMDSDEAGERWLRNVFFKWAEELGKKGIEVVLTAGNHDRYLFRRWNAGRTENWPKNVHYLIDKAETVKGVKFYGTPWCTNNQRTKRFECTEREAAEHFSKIPNGIDILISHSPPVIVGEKVDFWNGAGCHEGSTSLSEAILRAQPKLCVCGHVHGGSRKPVVLGRTMVLNVARVKGDRSQEAYKPQRIEFSK